VRGPAAWRAEEALCSQGHLEGGEAGFIATLLLAVDKDCARAGVVAHVAADLELACRGSFEGEVAFAEPGLGFGLGGGQSLEAG